MSSLPTVEHRNQEATCYVGNLDPMVDEDLLMELFNHVGRVSSVHMPKDKLTSGHNGYGFVEYRDVADADYAIQVLSMVKLHGRSLRVSKSSLDKKGRSSLDVGANLFLGNLDPDVDERLLYDTFSAFGTIVRPPRVMREDEGGVPNSGASKGYGFVSFDSFEASDTAIECMDQQYLCNRQITVQYAFRKSSTVGGEHGDEETTGRAPGSRPERHGSRAERMLAANNPARLRERRQEEERRQYAAAAAAAAAAAPPPPAAPWAGVGVGVVGGVMPPPPLPPPLPPAVVAAAAPPPLPPLPTGVMVTEMPPLPPPPPPLPTTMDDDPSLMPPPLPPVPPPAY